MDGKGRFLPSHGLQANHDRAGDNTFIERPWRTPKYQCVSLQAWGNRLGDESDYPEIDDLLQPPTPTLDPCRQTACRSLLAGNRRNPTRSAGAKSSSTNARYHPADGAWMSDTRLISTRTKAK
jgi:hypothetical protein